MSFPRSESTTKTGRRLKYLAFAAALFGLPGLAIADETFVLRTTVNIPGNAFVSGDISFVDPALDRYFFADRSNAAIDVINTNSKAIHQIGVGLFAGFHGNNDFAGPNGVLTVHQSARHHDRDHDADDRGSAQLWVGDAPHGTDTFSTVKVLSYPAGNLLHDISTGGLKRADEGCWDPEHHLVLYANDADSPPFISFISTDTYTVVGKIVFDGGSGAGHGPNATNGIEQCQWDERENAFYMNLPEVNGPGDDSAPGVVVVMSPHTLQVTQSFTIPLANCAGPQGMAIGPGKQILLGCNAPSPAIPPATTGVRNSAIINEENGHVIATLAGLGGADEVWFNPGDGHYFLGDSAATPNRIIGVVDSTEQSADHSIIISSATPSTNKGSHSVAADQERNEVYVPIPNNAGGSICPNMAIGCIAIFGPKGRDDHPVFVRRGDDDDGRWNH